MNKSSKKTEQVEEPSWEFHTESEPTTSNQPMSAPLPQQEASVTWTASEFIAHQKDSSWYATAAVATIAIAGVVFLVTDQSWFSAIIVMIAGAVFIAAAARPPRVLEYGLDSQGLMIADKLYPYTKFKSFSIVHEGPINSITLLPLERFMPSISLYYEPKDEEKIASVLGAHLPYEERELAQVDKLMRKIRF